MYYLLFLFFKRPLYVKISSMTLGFPRSKALQKTICKFNIFTNTKLTNHEQIIRFIINSEHTPHPCKIKTGIIYALVCFYVRCKQQIHATLTVFCSHAHTNYCSRQSNEKSFIVEFIDSKKVIYLSYTARTVRP